MALCLDTVLWRDALSFPSLGNATQLSSIFLALSSSSAKHSLSNATGRSAAQAGDLLGKPTMHLGVLYFQWLQCECNSLSAWCIFLNLHLVRSPVFSTPRLPVPSVLISGARGGLMRVPALSCGILFMQRSSQAPVSAACAEVIALLFSLCCFLMAQSTARLQPGAFSSSFFLRASSCF